MKQIFAIILFFGVLLSACAAEDTSPSAGNDTQNVVEQMVQEAEDTGQPEDEGEPELALDSNTDEILEETVEEQYLSAQDTYDMVGAVHANILAVESWLAQGISEYQRQAMVGPVVELSMAPLADLFETFAPQPDLALYWELAQDIHARFYPQVLAWVNGELDDAAFGAALVTLKVESNEMISKADSIAFQEFGIDTEAYQPNYAPAMAIVFELIDTKNYTLVGAGYQADTADASINPDMVVNEVNIYVHRFAGSELLGVIGLIENTGSSVLANVGVEFQFFNADGEYLGTTSGSITTLLAEPGKVYPFSASVVTDGEEIDIREQAVDYEVTVYAQPVSLEMNTYYRDFDLTLQDTFQAGSMYTVEGSLTNLGTQAVDSQEVIISAAGFDAGGKLVGVGEGSVAQAGTLTSGDAVDFEVFFRSVSGEPVRYQFYAETLLIP